MSTTTVQTAEQTPERSSRPWRAVPGGWAVFVVLLVAFTAFVLLNMRAGVGDDPRIANPDPGPAPYRDWLPGPVVFNLVSLGQVVVLFSVLLWWSWRRRKLHWAAVIALGAMFTGVIDPLANWATFASLNPKVPHLPTEWPWVRLAPLSDPVAAFLGGYASYYFAIGGMSYWLARRLVLQDAKYGSFRMRRPMLSLFLSAWIISFPFNALFQLAWMQVGMLVYTQFAGPALHVGHLQLPYLILLYDPFVYATLALLILPNDRGESLVLAKLASSLPKRPGRTGNTSARQVVVAGGLMIASLLVPISAFCAIRGLGLADNVVYDEWPFPETSVYDPYGQVEESGKPGPFHR